MSIQTRTLILSWAALIAQTAAQPIFAGESKLPTVAIDSYQFKPAHLTVKKGTVVQFENHDAAPHTVSPSKEGQFTGLTRLMNGQKGTIQFDQPGEYKYYCQFHPSMEGTITVK
jgi:plastocyanin